MATNDEKVLTGPGLEVLWGLIKAEDAKGVKIQTGSYVGTDTYGGSNPNSLTFDFTPELVYVTSVGAIVNPGYATFAYNCLKTVSHSGAAQTSVTVSWGGKGVTWYSSDSGAQLNAGVTYKYVAIGK